ncbi:SMR family transporter [Stappia indica]|uniref:SMR family transporter n=1 Tax=Stappia indica TaxID=538381 RepID=UPI001CD46092|nr:SMR family transporter [Stappia indica]MCA1299697.1 QacE family quaternary ammonium compound efflux SMR transporter [Stappia indica]
MQTYLFLGIAILGEVIATSALKASAGFTQLVPSVIVALGYLVAFYFLSLTLKVMPIGIAYGVWSGAGIILVSGIGWALFGQRLDAWGAIGIGFILLGVLIVNLLSKTTVH